MGYWNLERKLGVAGIFFLEIVKQQLFYKAAVFGVFFQIKALLSLKMHGFSQFSFWIPSALAKF